VWNVWKERNRRIFKDKDLTRNKVWEIININMIESIGVIQWSAQDLQVEASEADIFKSWNLGFCLNKNSLVVKVAKDHIQDYWTPPQEGFIKLNFDGASKGNPGSNGVGGVFSNHKGETLLLYATNLGIRSNNAVEIAGLGRAIKISIEGGLSSLEVEGDSQLVIIGMQLLNGIKVEKISQN
jgi:hypothetical protein